MGTAEKRIPREARRGAGLGLKGTATTQASTQRGQEGRHQLNGARTERLALPDVCSSSSRWTWSLLSGAPTAPCSSAKPAPPVMPLRLWIKTRSW